MREVEVELRSFVSDRKYAQLMGFLKKDARLVSVDNQVTHYFNDEGSVRIQKNDHFAKLWIKPGRLHDAVHEEIEVKVDTKDFGKLERAMSALGFAPRIKWFRLRHTFEWKGVSVMLDRTRGYGNIVELERICAPARKDAALALLGKRLSELGVEKTPIAEFDKRYARYRKNWRRLTRSA